MIVTLLVEAILVLECIQIVFMKKLKPDRFTIGFIVVDVVIYLLINLKYLPFIFVVVVYLTLVWMCYYIFQREILETIVRFFIGCALIAGIESIAAYIVYFLSVKNIFKMALPLSSLISLVVAVGIKDFCFIFYKEPKYRKNIWKSKLLLLYGLMTVGLFIGYYFKDEPINLNVLTTSIFIMGIFFYVYGLEIFQLEIEKKNYELDLRRVYSRTYESLLKEVRRRQHDYKNQIAAIYGMHLTAKNLDELIDMQRSYGYILEKNRRFDSILTSCNNPILAGFLYHRCIDCERNNVMVDYDIQIDQVECSFALHELIEILGILIDNGYEHVRMMSVAPKYIKIMFREETDKISFSVSNPTDYISFTEIERMFIEGYSRKGKNRGIGLPRVWELVNKYAAEIKVYNTNPRDEGNEICFLIMIEKDQGAAKVLA